MEEADQGMEWKRLIKSWGLPGQGMEWEADKGMGIAWSRHGVEEADEGMETCLVKAWSGRGNEGMGITWSRHGVEEADEGMETCLVKAWSGRGDEGMGITGQGSG